ncbi:heme biosynthesis protein HemY, partial [Mesorhizobium sp. M00.F.Ca.ET.158.01.1.1]
PVEVIDHAAPGNEATGKDAESREDHVTPVTAAAFAAVPADAEAVEPAEELARLPDDPGVDPDDEAEKSPRRFRLF